MNGVPWSDDEANRLTELFGDIPSPRVPDAYNRWASDNGYVTRTAAAIWEKAHRIGCSSRQVGEWLTISDIARILAVDTNRIERWRRQFRAILRPYAPFNGPRGSVYISRTNLRALARRHPDQMGGLDADRLFMLIEDRDLADHVATFPLRRGGPRRPVRCIDTGETFPTIAAAARAVGLDKQCICQALARGWRAAGRRWEAA